LHLNRNRLRREDLEDCFGQTVLELVAYVRRGGAFRDTRHIAAALELRFTSRIRDRRRALSGRSPMQTALESALSLGDSETAPVVVDPRADVERVVIAREEVRRISALMRQLTEDQRLVLAAHLSTEASGCAEFCERHGWSAEKYRKVSQRGRARLRDLLSRNEVPAATAGVPADVRESVEGAGTTYGHRNTA
jgi:DNA-directed RNA polymerase specialized sigma24 family protein